MNLERKKNNVKHKEIVKRFFWMTKKIRKNVSAENSKKKKTMNHPIYFAILRKKKKNIDKMLWNFRQFMIERRRFICKAYASESSERGQIQVKTRNLHQIRSCSAQETSPSYLLCLDDNSTHFSSFRIHLMLFKNNNMTFVYIFL